MPNKRVADFDAFLREHEAATGASDPVVLKAYGKSFDLPQTLKAKPVFNAIRMLQDKNASDEVDPGVLAQIMTDLVGEETFEALLEAGMEIAHIPPLMEIVIRTYSDEEANDQGNLSVLPRERTSSRKSSSPGGSSKRTSGGNTG